MTKRPLADAERLDWLRLIRSENVGPITCRQLLARFGSAAAALDAIPDLARRGGRRRPIKVAPRAEAEREIAALDALGARLIALSEPDYPEALAALDDAPPLIAVLGNPNLLRRPAVAIVGARNASLNGRKLARAIAADLGAAGYVVVSGLARGIDAAAHAGALETGTTAMLAGGVDIVYPKENRDLYDQIAARGVLISEMPPGTVPQARHFPRRNRLVSGAALGVLVIEAARRSGSLITARLAAEQGREVFAIPGSPLDPRHQGTNDLIRDGAVLTRDARDVVDVLSGMTRPTLADGGGGPTAPAAPAPSLDQAAVDAARAVLLELVGPSPVTVDELVRECQLSPAIVSMALLELDLGGRLARHPGNRVSLLIQAI